MGEGASVRYRARFNDIGQEIGLTWPSDVNKNGSPEPGELKVSPQFKKDHAWDHLTTEMGRQGVIQHAASEVRQGIETRRRAAMLEALRRKYLAPHVFEYDPFSLPEPIHAVLGHFHEISRLTEELRLLQLDPSGTDLWSFVWNKARNHPELADQNALTLFEWGYEGGCHPFVTDPFCEPVMTFPDLDPNTTMWPASLNNPDEKTGVDADLELLNKNPLRDAILSPFTVVEDVRGQEKIPLDKRAFKVTPYPRHPLFQSRLLRIAGHFEKIARTPGFQGLEPEMAGTALAYAASIRKVDGPFPFEGAEILWAKSRGRKIAFTWGPFEEGQDPHETKRTFQFNLFLVRGKETARVEAYQKAALQEVENRLAQRMKGFTAYQARTVRVDSVIQVYDVIDRSGGMNSSGGEFLAEVIPNSGPVVEGGFQKRAIFANLNEGTFHFVMAPLASLGLDPSQLQYVKAEFLLSGSVFHELSHSIGPTENQMIEKNGVRMKNKDAMGPGLWSAIEEAKANVGGIWMYQVLREKGVISREEEASGYVSYVANLLRQNRFGSKSPHGRGAKAELGYLFKTGAVEIREITFSTTSKQPRIHVNVERVPQAVTDLTVEIATAQNEGSTEKAQAFFAHGNAIPEAWDTVFVPRFDAVARHIKLRAEPKPPPPPPEPKPTPKGGWGCSASPADRLP